MTHYWFISTKYRKSSKLALITVLLAFVVIMLGAYTRLTDAGLSCPDWPNCFGYLTAPHTDDQIKIAEERFPNATLNVQKAWTEMTHRYVAGSEGLLILLLTSTMLFARKKPDTRTIITCFSLITLLATQILLGMFTVTIKLKPVIVLAHLLVGLSILSLLWWTYLNLHPPQDSSLNKASVKLIPWIWIGLLILACQISLGGWVSTHYAGLVCIDFPYCNGAMLPTLKFGHINSDLVTIHMLHRLGALATIIYTIVLSLAFLNLRSFKALGLFLLALLALQATLGILNIIWLRPVWVALLHHAVGIMLLLTMITALAKAYYESQHVRFDAWLA